jgi:prepilin-type N-terminal cleavage/methylation domain-containing protein
MKTKRNNFTLLEVMIAIALLALASGAVGWKIHALLKRERFKTDVARLEQLLLQSRMIALNTKADWHLTLQPTKKGWQAILLCQEDPDRSPSFGRASVLGPFDLSYRGKPAAPFTILFYSTGKVEPQGTFPNSSKIAPPPPIPVILQNKNFHSLG